MRTINLKRSGMSKHCLRPHSSCLAFTNMTLGEQGRVFAATHRCSRLGIVVRSRTLFSFSGGFARNDICVVDRRHGHRYFHANLRRYCCLFLGDGCDLRFRPMGAWFYPRNLGVLLLANADVVSRLLFEAYRRKRLLFWYRLLCSYALTRCISDW